MLEFTYHNYYLNCKDASQVRSMMVEFARQHGIKPAAREFATTPKTVRKWLLRASEVQDAPALALADRPRRPNTSPRRMKLYWQFKIIDVCQLMAKEHQDVNGAQLRREYHIPYSLPTVLKVMRQAGFAKPNRRGA
jgi:hypothetical protein